MAATQLMYERIWEGHAQMRSLIHILSHSLF